MVVSLVIDVNAKNVVVGFARSPGNLGSVLRVEVPDKIVYAVLEHHAFVDQLVEGCELLAGIRAPPEPVSTGFVQRTEDGGDAGLLQIQEDFGNEVDVSGDCLIGGREGVPRRGSLQEGRAKVEIRVVGLVAVDGVEFNFFTRTPVPCDCRDAAFCPDALRDIYSLCGVFLEPVLVLVCSGGVHQVDADESRVLAAVFIDGLHVFVLGGIAHGVIVHIAGHDARNSLLAKVVDQEVVELYCGGGCSFGYRCIAKVECLSLVRANVDVVYVDPTPAIGDGDGVFACSECENRLNIGKLALFGHRKRDLGRCTANFDIVDLVATVVVHVVNGYGVLAGLVDRNIRKSDVSTVHLDVLAARSFGACARGCIAGKGCIFGFVLGSASGSCCSKTECENGFSKVHDNSYIVRLENRLKKEFIKEFFLWR